MKKLKRYKFFLKESISRDDFETDGEYIEKLAEDDDFALSLIAQHTGEINPTIRLANAINLLSPKKRQFLIEQILKAKTNPEPEEASVMAYTDLSVLESEMGGKNLFKCFLKMITALGQKSINLDWNERPEDFIAFYLTQLCEVEDLKSVASRYEFFEEAFEEINISLKSKLYYGIKSGLIFEYGILSEGQKTALGEFKITKSVFRDLSGLSSPSSVNLKIFLSDFDFTKLKLVDKIKNEMSAFVPGYHEKKSFFIKSGILKFGFYGIGKWDNGKMDSGEKENIKNNFKSYLMKYNWSDSVQINISEEQFWLYFKVKLK